MKKIISLLFVWVIGLQAHAQITPKTLSAEEVLLIVKQYHPVVKQAAIAIQKRKAGVLIARSAFDPI